MKKVYIILFYLIHLHGSRPVFPFCKFEDLDTLSEFKLPAEDSLREKCDSILPCDRCNFAFSTKSSLQKHKCQKEKKEQAQKFSKDSDQEEDDSDLVKRAKRDSTGIDHETTGIDKKKIYSHSSIKLMGLLFYPIASEISTKCQFCDFVLPITDEKWKDHIKKHVELKKTKNEETNKLKCCYDDSCPTEFNDRSRLFNHVIMHMGLKLFHCDKCFIVFPLNSCLLSHKKTTHKNQ